MDNELANTSTGAAFGGISVRKARQCLTFIWTGAARRLSRAALFAALAIATTAIHAFTVTPANGANGSISPAVPQTVAAGASISFTVTANAGFIATVSGTCGGQLAGDVFTTAPVSADCSVVAGFAAGVRHVVTSTAETGPGTWTAALIALEATNNGAGTCGTGTKRIEFNIPAATDPGCNPVTGVCVVQLEFFNGRSISCTDVVIDGYTQPGASVNTSIDHTTNAQLKIEFAGTKALDILSSRVSVRGIAFPAMPVGVRSGISGLFGLFSTVNPVFAGNYFGWHADGLTAAGTNAQRLTINNSQGIPVLTGARIGGPNPADRNLFTDTGARDGISLGTANNTLIEGNVFNLDRNGNAVPGANSNSGIFAFDFVGGNRTTIRRNVIARTGRSGYGCGTSSNSGVTLTENEIFDVNLTMNADGRGIELLAGCNHDQSAPIVSTVTYGASVNVQGTLSSVASETFKIEFFHNATPDTANIGRAEQFVGFVDVTTDGNGVANFAANLPAFVRNVSATATRVSNGDTSTFSVAHITPQTMLTVNKSGSPTSVVTSVPAGIDCGNTCAASFAPGTQVTLTAVPAGGTSFLSWSGACANSSGTCSVTMDAAKNVTAIFGTPAPAFSVSPTGTLNFAAYTGVPSAPQTITVTSTGNTAVTGLIGAMVLNPELFTIINNCPASLPPSATCTMDLILSPPIGTGGQGGTVGFRISSSNAGAATAIPVFNQVLSGSVSATPSSLSFSALAGTTSPSQTLTFTVADGVASNIGIQLNTSFGLFQLTSDGCTGQTLSPGQSCQIAVALAPPASTGTSGGTLGVALDAAAGSGRIGLASTPLFYAVTSSSTLTVNRTGTGTGSVVSGEPTPLIACGATCSALYAIGTVVTLTATPTAGSTFTGWSGACSNASGPCLVSINAIPKEVTANFGPKPIALITVISTRLLTGALLSFSGTRSAALSPGETIASYRWSLTQRPVGSTVVPVAVETPSRLFEFTPDRAGLYELQLEVTSSLGAISNPTSVRFTVTDFPKPSALITVISTRFLTGTLLSFSGTRSAAFSPGETITSYRWSLTQRPVGSTVVPAAVVAASPSFEFTPDRAGLYELQLEVTSSLGDVSSPESVQFTVTDFPKPVAQITVISTSFLTGALLSFSGTRSAAFSPGETITSYRWSLTQRPVGSTVVPAAVVAVSRSFEFTPDRPGLYELQLEVTSSLGDVSNPDSVQFTVAGEPILSGTVSRKTHGLVGTFDLSIKRGVPIDGKLTVEPRFGGGSHMIVFQFDQPVASVGAVTVRDASGIDVGTSSAMPADSTVEVRLTGIPDKQRLAINVTGVNGSNAVFSTTLGFLVADVNNSRSVDGFDVGSVRARAGQIANGANFMFDLNTSGSVSATDILVAKARLGRVLN